MSQADKDRVLALAGIALAAECVYQLATTGKCEEADKNALLESLFVFDAPDTQSIYGSAEQLKHGLEILGSLAQGHYHRSKSAEIIKYGFGLLHLQRRLNNRPEMLAVIRSRLEHIELRKQHFSTGEPDHCDALSELYKDTLSTFKFRIQVNGQARFLQQAATADTIRALLLAGVRSAILWRQLGGKQWQLFFQRKQVAQQAEQWLKSF